MNSLIKLVEKIATARGITALLVLILVAIFVYKNFDFISEVTLKVDRPRPTQVSPGPPGTVKSSSEAYFSIERVQIVPVDFDLPSSFYAELENTGYGVGEAEAIIDFGPANIVDFEIRPTRIVELLYGGKGQNVLKLGLHRVSEGERVYVYALLSQPGFRSIVINLMGTATNRDTFTHEDYEAQSRSGIPTTFKDFLYVLLAGCLIVAAGYLWVIVHHLLLRVFPD